ncbi:hypothetical protein C8J57DRAFT_1622512, partial [Mycena rebaudengoi]
HCHRRLRRGRYPSKIPANLVKLGFKQTPKTRAPVKKEPSTKMASLLKTPKAVKTESSSDASAFTPDSAADIRGLPAFAEAQWESHFLPELYDALDRSPDPMNFGAYGDSKTTVDIAVASIQAVLNAAYPGNGFKVQWGDKICSRAICRIRGRRNTVKSSADTAVAAYVAEKQFANAGEVKVHVGYALRGNGPAFWRDPTPIECRLPPTHPDYIKPNGYLESALMVSTLKPLLKNAKVNIPEGSTGKEYDRSELPQGLLGMVKAAIRRSLSLYTDTGVLATGPPPQFSSETSGAEVTTCVATIQTFTWTRWSSILFHKRNFSFGIILLKGV